MDNKLPSLQSNDLSALGSHCDWEPLAHTADWMFGFLPAYGGNGGLHSRTVQQSSPSLVVEGPRITQLDCSNIPPRRRPDSVGKGLRYLGCSSPEYAAPVCQIRSDHRKTWPRSVITHIRVGPCLNNQHRTTQQSHDGEVPLQQHVETNLPGRFGAHTTTKPNTTSVFQ